jgi:hypothetical protein
VARLDPEYGIDWDDVAAAGRIYADNLAGEPAVSRLMRLMADEIDKLRADRQARRDELTERCCWGAPSRDWTEDTARAREQWRQWIDSQAAQ